MPPASDEHDLEGHFHMDVRQFLTNIQSSYFYRDQVAHVESIPARDAQYVDLGKPLPPPVANTLQQMGIERLYTHQSTAIEKARAGKNVVIVTSTASGKTLYRCSGNLFPKQTKRAGIFLNPSVSSTRCDSQSHQKG